MKKLILLFIVATSIAAITGFKMHTDVYKVDVEKSVLEWYAEKVGGKHNGTIKLSQGEISNNHGNLNGRFDIDMTSIENKDLTNEGSKAKIEKHLKSADFFDTEKFPKATFVITALTAYDTPTVKGDTHKVTGMLTIKDKTNDMCKNIICIKENGKSIISTIGKTDPKCASIKPWFNLKIFVTNRTIIRHIQHALQVVCIGN